VYRKLDVSTEQSEASTRRAPLRAVRQQLRTLKGSPWIPAVAVLLGYGWWLLIAFRSGHEARDFIVIGPPFVRQAHTSTVIKLDPHYHYLPGTTGYDGQFAYFIALDPVHARDYLDTNSPGSAGPDYRYTRILYPMLARAIALGQANAIPYTLIAINWLAVALGTLAVAAWLRRKRVSPWFSLLYGLYPGIFVTLQRDLNEALAYALVALAVYLYDLRSSRALLAAALSFALASLARETTLVFPFVYALSALAESRSTQRSTRKWILLAFVTLSFGPFVVWKGFLWHWLGSIGRTGGVYPQPVPFRGLLSYWPWGSDGFEQFVAIVVPAMLCLGLCCWALKRRLFRPELWALLLNILLFVVFLNTKSYVEYYASGRIAIGVVLGALYCLPLFHCLARRIRWWIWVCALLWLSLLPALSAFPRRPVVPTDALADLGVVALLWVVTRLTRRESIPTLRGDMKGSLDSKKIGV
jgi:hypothetical protein